MKKIKNLLMRGSLLLAIFSNSFVLAMPPKEDPATQAATTSSEAASTTTITTATTTVLTVAEPVVSPAREALGSLPASQFSDMRDQLMRSRLHLGLRTLVGPNPSAAQAVLQLQTLETLNPEQQLSFIAQSLSSIQTMTEREFARFGEIVSHIATNLASSTEVGGARHQELLSQIAGIKRFMEQSFAGQTTDHAAMREDLEALRREVSTGFAAQDLQHAQTREQMDARITALGAQMTSDLLALGNRVTTGFADLRAEMMVQFKRLEAQMEKLGVTQEEFVECGMAIAMIAAEHVPVVGRFSPTRLISLKDHPFILLSLVSFFEGPGLISRFVQKYFPNSKVTNNFLVKYFSSWISNTGIAKWHQRSKKALRMAYVAKAVIWAFNGSGCLAKLRSLVTPRAIGAPACLASVGLKDLANAEASSLSGVITRVTSSLPR